MRKFFVLTALGTVRADGAKLFNEVADIGDVDGIMFSNADHLCW